jgi:hypothetical protein
MSIKLDKDEGAPDFFMMYECSYSDDTVVIRDLEKLDRRAATAAALRRRAEMSMQ